LKNNEQKRENKIQKYTKPEKNIVFRLTRATIFKNDFMTLIFFGGVIFKQALQKRMCAL
jgi:hypothetical protein